MNKLPLAKRTQILAMLCEGSSMRSISRVAGVSINTVTKMLVDAGEACAAHYYNTVRGVKAKRVQCDEIWSFCYAKAKNVPAAKTPSVDAGNVWTWTAIDADSKLIISYMVGDRDAETGMYFMDDLRERVDGRMQLTTDGHKAYLDAVATAFPNEEVDYAMLVKLYGTDPGKASEKRYSPAECIGIRKRAIMGDPDNAHVSTSYVERQNLTMRIGMRRFTRLTNGFSKKLDNHMAAIALHFMHYNFARTHKTIECTPAMAAGVADHRWSLIEIAGLLD